MGADARGAEGGSTGLGPRDALHEPDFQSEWTENQTSYQEVPRMMWLAFMQHLAELRWNGGLLGSSRFVRELPLSCDDVP